MTNTHQSLVHPGQSRSPYQYEGKIEDSESLGQSLTNFSKNVPETASSIMNTQFLSKDLRGSPKLMKQVVKRNNRFKDNSNEYYGISDSENNTITNIGGDYLKFAST